MIQENKSTFLSLSMTAMLPEIRACCELARRDVHLDISLGSEVKFCDVCLERLAFSFEHAWIKWADDGHSRFVHIQVSISTATT